MESTTQSSPLLPQTSSLPSTFVPAKNGLVSFSHSISVKLNKNNFLHWHQQIESSIYGYQLDQYILKDPLIPERFASATDATSEKLKEAYVS